MIPAHAVIAALKRRKEYHSMARLSFAHAVRVIFWLALCLLLVSLWSGCTVDRAGLAPQDSPVLTRGDSDAGVKVQVSDVQEGGVETNRPDDSALAMIPDSGERDSGGTQPDSKQEAPDLSGSTDGGRDEGRAVDSLPPSECPISPTRSLTPCTSTTAVCRYYDTGAPVLMSGCTAEGFLCVRSCS